MQVSKETITPKKAMEWLKRNVHNRPLGLAHVNRLAGALVAGKWKLNGETIKFNGNGDLIDGQHRLNACVKASVPFESYVVRGLEHSAFDTIDQGKSRSAGDVLARRGEKNYNALAAAVRIVHSIRNTGTVDVGNAIRADEVVACLDENPGIRDACDFASKNGSAIISRSTVTALLYLFREKDPIAADLFWSRVLNGEGITSNMPEYRLRARLIENSTSTARLRIKDIAGLTIKAWNMVRAGRTVKCLMFADREEFPAIQ